MKKQRQRYVAPLTESYPLENESFIAGSSNRAPVNLGGGSDGWSINKGGGNSTVGEDGEELL